MIREEWPGRPVGTKSRLPGFVAVGERRYDEVFHVLDFRREAA